MEVYTGVKSNSGTDAHVYLEMHGSHGDTGRRRLLKSLEAGNKFETGKRDAFLIEAVDLEELEELVVGHDGQGFGAGWFLEKIIVREKEGDYKRWLFNCNR